MGDVDVAIVGAGVTGLATALAVAERGLSTCVLDRHPRPGLETSTHNSGVIHAGIYFPAATLKTRLCIEGRRLLYEFCETHQVPHERCGKLIVAFDESDMAGLEALRERGLTNGVERLELVHRRFIAEREPAIRAHAAIFSPETGIVDADRLVKALAASAVARGAILLPGTQLIGADRRGEGMTLHTEREQIRARIVVNAAGLYADTVSKALGGETFTIYPCRGEYAELVPSKRGLVRALVYPLPHGVGYGHGVHLLRSTSGEVWIGPTAQFQSRKDDYEGDRLPLDAFVEPTRQFLPEITREDLRLAGSGIRPKLYPPAESFADFLIRRDQINPAVVQAAGIESPGLTSCLAIGRMVRDIISE
jgi:L-2-hydroxyglutarate oxidase LhgO